MEKQELVLMGIITSAHGIRGDVKIKSYTKPLEAICNYPLLNDAGDSISLKLKSINKDMLVCRCNLSDNRNAAEELRNTNLYTAKSNLAPLKGDEYYIDSLEGMNVINKADNQVIGSIKAIHNFGAGDIIEVVFKNGTREMLPFSKNIFIQITDEGVYYVEPKYTEATERG